MPPRVDVETVLRDATMPGEGWRVARLSHGVPTPGSTGFEGLVSPDGRCWEVTFRWKDSLSKLAERKRIAEHIANQRAGNYEVYVVPLQGETVVVERFRGSDALRLWDGLHVVGEWEINGFCPTQGEVVADWTRPDQVIERVVLYLWYRDWGIDPEGTVWQGHVQRHDGSDIFAGIRAPWSPNLLPTVAPRDAPPAEQGMFQIATHGGLGLLSRLRKPSATEVGFLEDDKAGAKRALVGRAERWLRENGLQDDAWDYCVPASSE